MYLLLSTHVDLFQNCIKSIVEDNKKMVLWDNWLRGAFLPL